ncbi:MAG: hypothetical protein A6F70_05380 [Cycloclasticus sp. symbiont of Bathymodiolus heckerae]|nr:MAG: hypothetical protein A6F70_05380 [Cycloclasticus sp. symbiont of Bathymodiolus heckerae]
MTTKNHDAFEQFNTLIGSNIPEEYKNILKSFQQQGQFYHQFFQNINSNDEGLSSFWDLPNTLGFNMPNHEQPDWIKSIFDINNVQGDIGSSPEELFSQFVPPMSQQIKDKISNAQADIVNMGTLHSELSELALKRFQTLRNESEDTSNEQLSAHWLAAGEDAFAEISQRDDYVQAQNKLLETLGDLKSTQHALTEQLSNTWGLPTQQSLQDLQKGLHQLRIEFAEYKEQTGSTIDELKATIRKLK